MPSSIRFTPKLETQIKEYCQKTGQNKSYLIQQSVAEYLVAHNHHSLYELGQDLFDDDSSNTGKIKDNKSTEWRKRYRAYAKAKHAKRTR